jgi:hypothetical protein
MRNANQFITVSLGRASPLTGSLFSLSFYSSMFLQQLNVCVVELQSGAFFKKQ